MSEALGGAMKTVIDYFTADRRTKMGSLILDILVTEEIEMAADVSLYPVETGSLITDNVTQGVEKLRLAGLVSTADVTAFSFAAIGNTKIVDAIEALRTMHKARALVTISTGQMIYKEFAFTSMSATRSNGSSGGNWLEIKAELIKVRKVTLRKADVPAAPAAAPASGRAGQTNTPAGLTSATTTGTPTPANVSVAAGLTDRARAALPSILPSLFGR